MTPERYCEVRKAVCDAGWETDLDYYCTPRDEFVTSWTLVREHIWVVLNSGMRFEVARQIHARVMLALVQKRDISTVFGHKAKCKAIKHVVAHGRRLYAQYHCAKDKLAFLETLPHIGKITKYHLGKNLGIDCAKPDRHLVRLAKKYGKGVQELCLDLAAVTGDTVACVDYVLWRAVKMGLETP